MYNKFYFKKIILILVVFAILFSVGDNGLSAIQSKNTVVIQIGNPVMTVSGEKKEIDPGRGTVPVIDSGRTLVPIRAVTESMGAVVSWNPNNSTVTINAKEKNMLFKIGSNDVYVNGAKYIMDCVPQIINGRTMMPIRFISEQLMYTVTWNDAEKIIVITDDLNYDSNLNDKNAVTVHFIDVGQGDSEFVELSNGETMLIDAGPSKSNAAEYIKSLGYDKINYVIATHPDADHIGSMDIILKTFKVDKFYMPNKSHTTKTFERMLDALYENGCECIYAEGGMDIVQSVDMNVSFLAPCNIYEDSNDMSAVIKIKHNNVSFLFTGDIGINAEKDIVESGVDLRADVLKVAHHGSRSSSSQLFLDCVKPSTAVISVGKNNKYGHPTDDVLKRFEKMNISVYRTDLSKTIKIKSNGTTYSVSAEAA